jgi:DNA-binding transcriptional ArsR family regulator
VPKTAIEERNDAITDELVQEVATVLKALSTPIRLRIVCELCTKPRTVSELIQITAVRQTLVSQQLATLRELGIIASRRDGTKMIYRIADENAIKIVSSLCEIYKK